MAINKRDKKLLVILIFFISSVYLIGCAEFNLFQAPTEVLKHPLGTDPVRLGMSKEEVTSLWGEPDQKNQLEPTDEWKTPKEEWVYLGRYSKVPIDKSYLFKTKHLIFDGNNLVSIKEE